MAGVATADQVLAQLIVPNLSSCRQSRDFLETADAALGSFRSEHRAECKFGEYARLSRAYSRLAAEIASEAECRQGREQKERGGRSRNLLRLCEGDFIEAEVVSGMAGNA